LRDSEIVLVAWRTVRSGAYRLPVRAAEEIITFLPNAKPQLWSGGPLALHSDAHDFVFLVLAELVDFSDVGIGGFLDFVESAAFVVFGDGFVF